MAAIELNLNPTNRQLKQFGLIGMCALPILGWLIAGKPMPNAWETVHTQRVGIFASFGAVVGALGLLKPSLLKWVFIAASVITFPIGFVLGEIVMSIVYTIAFVPLALLFRTIGRDALHRNIDSDAESYWQAKEQPQNASSYYRQS